jgi:hypothetical protein
MADKWHKMIGRLKQEILDIGLVARAVTEGGLGYATESWSDAYDRIPLGSRCCAIVGARLLFRVFTSLRSLHSGVAMPLDFCHFARFNVDLKRAAWPWEAIFRQRHNIVAWAERNSEATLTICCKRSDRALLVRDRKDRAWKRRHVWNFGSLLNRPRPDRTDRNNSFNSGTPTGIGFSKGKGSLHKDEREKQREVPT